MPKTQHAPQRSKDEPDDHDFAAAAADLSLPFPERVGASLVDALRGAEPLDRKAEDLLRASRLPPCPTDDPRVAKELKKVSRGCGSRRCSSCAAGASSRFR